MPRVFYGIRRGTDGRWVVVNKEGKILSHNGYPMTHDAGDRFTDIFGCDLYGSYLKQSSAEKQADEWERSCLLFDKPKMSTRELFFIALSKIDWLLAVIGVLCIIKAFWK